MSHKAVRTDFAEFDREAAPILSRIEATAGAGTSPQACIQALEAAIQETHEGQYAALENGFLLSAHWEPPYKLVRTVSSKFPEVRITVTSDAFKSEYWIARAVYEKGLQVSDATLTMNDGEAFENLFREIHGESHAQWKSQNKQGKARGGFAWGAVADFDSSKSELGKAEGQL
ncbi:MAG: hypothetical protein LBV54_06925 [Puniceicoccales bacterium]|jgi:hypothetical protein|nr:hypothetical protein [Puniceicoccales bacterium]